ncbi:MAG: DNA polymerase III subunit alpha [Roseicyclus sp.]|nr:DNA polymerase III subunit alpha [Roseicyclus sp.]
MSKAPRFIHLRLHSEYSLLEGAMKVKKLPGMVADAGMPAVAVTDTNNMFCALEFSETAARAGVQPIVGCQIDVEYEVAAPGEKPRAPAAVVLLAQDRRGYEHLMKLNSALYLRGDGTAPHVTLAELERHSDGLICLSGGPNGPVGQHLRAARMPKAEALLKTLSAIYPDRLYVELQRHPGEGGLPEAEKLSERGHVELAYALGLPLVATNDVYFPKADIFEAHDAMMCIAQGAYVDQSEPRRRLTPQHSFKSPDEMAALFADLPEALENTIEIARRCTFRVETHEPILPKFADNEVEELRAQSNAGLQARLAVIPHAASVEDYQKRLDFELGIIERMGFPGYFLIVADFIKWSKDQLIPVGPGRGSGAGSLVAYALTITDLDPLRYSLLFERFLNPERVSMPDFDIDFCMDRREEVIRYVQEKYGRDRVGQIITFGALLSKAAVRDVGRVLQMPFGQVDRLSKMIPVEGVKPVSISQAVAQEERIREEMRESEQDKRDGRVNPTRRLFDYAEKIEGLLRNASTHAAGVVIGDRPLDELVPLYRDPRSDMPATQFNMKWVEPAGLVKFDFLGLKTLTVVQNAIELIHKSGRQLHEAPDGTRIYEPASGGENQINAIPLDDTASYELYASAKTVAVFQVESSGMMDALRRMKPNCIEDIIALVALYRPGPMENIPKFCEVKNGLSDREKLHPTIDHILDETQGIIVYQEQVMQIAQEMAGYSLGGADLLRRAMGKKLQEAMDVERPKFLKGAGENGVDEAKAIEVWNLLDKFANYGFNKSHAAAYAVVSYQTAWLKANHPVEFMAAVMNCDIHLTDKLAVYKQEVDRMGIETLPPCVNRSAATFTVDAGTVAAGTVAAGTAGTGTAGAGEGGKILYALGALKNVGVEAMKMIVEARTTEQGVKPYATLFDLARRVDLKRVGKRSLEMLTRAGAFDALDRNRARVMGSLDGLTAYSAAVHDQAASDQVSLFGDAGDDLPEPRLSGAPDWLPNERLAAEHQAVGFYFSGHPLDDYQPALKRRGVMTLAEVEIRVQQGPFVAKMAGAVSVKQERKSQRGNRFAFVSLSDPTGLYEITVFSDTLEASREFLETGSNVIVQAEATLEADQLKLLARNIQPVDNAIAGESNGLRVFIADETGISSVESLLKRTASEGASGTGRAAKGPIHLCLMAPDLPGEVDVVLGDDFPVSPQIKGALRSLEGIVMVEEV